jgi:hypothetical protein
MSAVPRFEPEKIFEILQRHEVDYVLIGGVAATLHGSNLRTGDVDICPSREPANLQRLAAALRDLGAKVRTIDSAEGLPFAVDEELLGRMEMLNLVTRFGEMDIAFTPAGTGGYDELCAEAESFDLGELSVPTASIDDIIRSKEAANRPKDVEHLRVLRLLRGELDRQKADRSGR